MLMHHKWSLTSVMGLNVGGFIVRLTRESERSVSIKPVSGCVMLSRAGSACLRQRAGRQGALLPGSCGGGGLCRAHPARGLEPTP